MVLRNAAMNMVTYKKQIETLKNQYVDVSNFEANLDLFKQDILKASDFASKKKDSAIDRLDKTITCLQQIKDDILLWEKHVSSMEKKADKLTVMKLTKSSPVVAGLIAKSQTNQTNQKVS